MAYGGDVSTTPTHTSLAAPGYADAADAPNLHERRMQQWAVVEHTHDLAIADRVAFVLASRTGMTHLVLAEPGAFAIACCPHAEHVALLPASVVAIATDSGIRPVLQSYGTAYTRRGDFDHT